MDRRRGEKKRDDGRPDPEALLRRYNLLDPGSDTENEVSASVGQDTQQQSQGARSDHRGHLRVYLGASAGVGKTYAMLNEGHRRKTRDTDVVVGYVETHKRSQTEAQIGDLEIMPRK